MHWATFPVSQGGVALLLHLFSKEALAPEPF